MRDEPSSYYKVYDDPTDKNTFEQFSWFSRVGSHMGNCSGAT